MNSKKLITSALPYVNNVPHLGNVIGCVLSADVYARYCRAAGYKTLYICATDEYGTATETKAREENKTPKEICDIYHAIHKKIYEDFHIEFDHFGRTSDLEQTKITQSIFKDLDKNGLIEEKETAQTYCDRDHMFLADRYVEGQCPFCSSHGARGDQCDSCGKLLQPTDLIDPKCQVCSTSPTEKLTKHLYIDLPKLESKIKAFQERSYTKGNWSNNAIAVSKGWLEQGLLPRPITRDLKWGIPIPRSGYENKVFYVWFDAPIGYISATVKHLPDSWEEWWRTPDTTELYQFMGKDNIPFHTVIFPATLLGTGESWTMLHHINTTEYLNYEGQKFSKSRKTGVFADDVMSTGIHIDLWRFYLLHNRPEKSDFNFHWDGFLEDINSNFIDNIGNLLNRVLVFFHRNFPGALKKVPFNREQRCFLDRVREAERNIVDQFESVAIKDTMNSILALGRMGNKFFQDQAPWEIVKTDSDTAMATLVTLIYLCRDLGILLSPYMPETSERIRRMTGENKNQIELLGEWDDMHGRVISRPEILFQKLSKKHIDQLKRRFGSGVPAKEPVPIDPFEAWEKIVIKVGKITKVSPHPSANRLYIEEVDCGETKPRTIVSGLVGHYAPEDLLGKKVLIAANLAPIDLRGIVSQGMVLTAEKGEKLEVITIESVPVGSLVRLENENRPFRSEQIDIDQFLAAAIAVDDFTLHIKGKPLTIEGNAVKTQRVEKAAVK